MTPSPSIKDMQIRVAGLLRGGWHELTCATERRIPFLDALRTFAVLLVMNYHCALHYAEDHGQNRYTMFPAETHGWAGVDLFFVLSGYFIGTQLWRELQQTGTLSYRLFFIRRSLRIWPLYYAAYAVVLWITPAAGRIAVQYGWTDLVFLTNYFSGGIVRGGWSLCTEEQFYLLAPLALLLLGRRTPAFYRRGLAMLMGLEVVARIATYIHLTGHWRTSNPHAFGVLYYPFHLHSDGLFAGMIVASLAVEKNRRGLMGRPVLLVISGLAALVLLNLLQGETLTFTGLAIFFACLVWWGITSGTQMLKQHIFYLGSRLSFGMYLNHWYLIPAVAKLLGGGPGRPGSPAHALLEMAAVIPCSALLSAVTFLLIEHPFLVLRTRMLHNRRIPALIAR